METVFIAESCIIFSTLLLHVKIVKFESDSLLQYSKKELISNLDTLLHLLILNLAKFNICKHEKLQHAILLQKQIQTF